MITKSEMTAQGQLDAYNKRDIDTFMFWYAENIKAYDIDTDLLLFEGKKSMSERYTTLFENKHLNCKLKNRMVLGATVIDHEEITRDESGMVFEAIAIYDINNEGLIETVRFTRGKI